MEEKTAITALVIILSVVTISTMVVLIVVLIKIQRMIKKVNYLASASSESVNLFKQQLLKKVGLIGALRFLIRRYCEFGDQDFSPINAKLVT